MAHIEVFTQAFCGYCHRAKALLTKKGVEFSEIDVMLSPDGREEMLRRTDGAKTVPQIFIDGALIGGYDDLARLDREGRLDSLLGITERRTA